MPMHSQPETVKQWLWAHASTKQFLISYEDIEEGADPPLLSSFSTVKPVTAAESKTGQEVDHP